MELTEDLLKMAADNADFTAQYLLSTEDPTTDVYTLSGFENITHSHYTLLKNFQHVNISVRLLIGLLAINSNLLTVVAIGHYEYLRSCTNYVIAALAVSDMIGGFTCLPLLINYVTPMTDETWLNMCAAERTLNLLSPGTNVAYILLIAVDRFIFITFPLCYYSLVTPRLTLGAILLPFILILLVLVIVNLAIEEYLQPLGDICRGIFPKLAALSINTWFYVCTPVTVLLYTRIAWIAYKQSRAIDQAQNTVANQEHKITKMLSLVLGVYMMCYMPQFTVFALKQYFARENFVIIERVSSWIWWINSCVNPFIYAWKNKDFNRAFRSLLGLRKPAVNPMQGNPTINNAP